MDLQRARELLPDDEEVIAEIQQIRQKLAGYAAQERQIYAGMMKKSLGTLYEDVQTPTEQASQSAGFFWQVLAERFSTRSLS